MTIAACGVADTDAAVPVIGRPPATVLPPSTAIGHDIDTANEFTPDNRDDDGGGGGGGSDAVTVGSTGVADSIAIETAASEPAVLVPASTMPPSTTTATSTTSSTTTPTTTTTEPPPATTTTEPAPTIPPPEPPGRVIADPAFTATNAAFDRFARSNAATSVSVVRGGEIIYTRAAGRTIDDQEATGDSPMVVASVSKIVVAIAVARLHQQGALDVFAPVPWTDIGLAPHPAWSDVTVRELLDHRSGLAKARFSWFTGAGTCRDYVPTLLSAPPLGHRGTWVYSNGNYCLLGLLVAQRTGLALDVALQQLVFDPVGVTGVHLTDGGLQPGDLPHREGVERLSRLGGAGTLIVSTDDTAMALGRLTPADFEILQAPGVFTDQYGFGHTGTVDGAKACVWLLEFGRTVVSATIAGNSVSSGGGVCDAVVPAIATDIGVWAGPPDRTP